MPSFPGGAAHQGIRHTTPSQKQDVPLSWTIEYTHTAVAQLRKLDKPEARRIMEATLVGDATLPWPKEVVDRDAAADRIAAKYASTPASSDDLGRTEDVIMADAIAEVTASRRERRRER